jgi:hypothetical protein
LQRFDEKIEEAGPEGQFDNATAIQDSDSSAQAPIEERRALARDWL